MSTDYEQVAERHADAEDFAAAVEAQRRAVEAGPAPGEADPREMLAWYLLKAGDADEATALWETLLGERPDDPELLLTAGVAHRDAEHYERATELLEQALLLTLERTLDAEVLSEATAERTLALTALGRGAEPVDERAAAVLAIFERQASGESIAAPWVPADQFDTAKDALPSFASDWGDHDHAAYSQVMDRRLRDVTGVHGHAPVIVPLDVAQYVRFAGDEGLPPDWAETRTRYADRFRDEAIAWPPGRNDDCWCGADAKYKRHCGA